MFGHVVQRLITRQNRAVLKSTRDAPCPNGDIVHWDFQSANILVDGGAVSGVVDWEGTCLGDCTFDLATLLYYAYADENHDAATMRDTLWQHAIERVTPGVFGMYLAHMILRQVDWSIRFYDHAVVARYLDASRHALHDVAYHMTQ